MELRKLYNQFREDEKWARLANHSIRKVETTLFRKHGNVEAETLTREQLQQWLTESNLPKDYTVPTASVVNYMMVWAGLWKEQKPTIVKRKTFELVKQPTPKKEEPTKEPQQPPAKPKPVIHKPEPQVKTPKAKIERPKAEKPTPEQRPKREPKPKKKRFKKPRLVIRKPKKKRFLKPRLVIRKPKKTAQKAVAPKPKPEPVTTERRCKAQGCIYKEPRYNVKSSGRCSSMASGKYIRGVGWVRGNAFRWCAEIVIHGRRFRYRSPVYEKAAHWLRCIRIENGVDD